MYWGGWESSSLGRESCGLLSPLFFSRKFLFSISKRGKWWDFSASSFCVYFLNPFSLLWDMNYMTSCRGTCCPFGRHDVPRWRHPTMLFTIDFFLNNSWFNTSGKQNPPHFAILNIVRKLSQQIISFVLFPPIKYALINIQQNSLSKHKEHAFPFVVREKNKFAFYFPAPNSSCNFLQ